MFGTIRKHSKWMWTIIIAGIIVSFVVFFTPGAFQDAGPGNYRVTIEGRTFDRSGIDAVQREAAMVSRLGLLQQFQFSVSPDARKRMSLLAMSAQPEIRLVLLVKLEQHGIEPGPEAAASWIRANILNDTGPYAGMTFEQVVKEVVVPAGLKAEDLTRFARNQAGFEVLLESVTAPAALIAPAEVEAAYRRDHQKLEVEVAYVASSNFLSKVVLDPAGVTNFYQTRMSAYRSPDRVQVHYVRLATSNHLAQAEAELIERGDFERRIDQSYLARTNYFAGKPEADAKAQIRQEMIDEAASLLARRKAYDFINKYYDSPFEAGPEKAAELMQATAAAEGLEMKTTNPFSREEYPENLSAGFEFVEAAFSLKPDDPFSTAVSAVDGYYALCFDERVPGKVRPFEEVREQVEEEFQEEQSRRLAREAATAFHQAATNAVASGQSFSALAELSGFTVAKIPGLSLRTTSVPGVELPTDLRTLLSMVSSMETNSVSEPQFAADGMLVLRTGERSAPDPLEMAAGLDEYRTTMRRSRESELLSAWVLKQVDSSGLQSALSAPR